jgi:hypothetical protein
MLRPPPQITCIYKYLDQTWRSIRIYNKNISKSIAIELYIESLRADNQSIPTEDLIVKPLRILA